MPAGPLTTTPEVLRPEIRPVAIAPAPSAAPPPPPRRGYFWLVLLVGLILTAK